MKGKNVHKVPSPYWTFHTSSSSAPLPLSFAFRRGRGLLLGHKGRNSFLFFFIIKLDSYMISNFKAYLDSDRGVFCFVFFMRPKCYQDWATDVLYNLFTFIPVK